MPKGFSVGNLLDAQAITLLRTLSALVSMLLLLCPLTTVAAVSCGSIMAAVYTARPLSVTLPGNAVFPCSSCRNKRHTINKEQMKSTMCLLSKVMCVCVQRSRKPSSVDVHRKGSQRQRCQSASCKVCHVCHFQTVHGFLML